MTRNPRLVSSHFIFLPTDGNEIEGDDQACLEIRLAVSAVCISRNACVNKKTREE
jgi:hypothetical protein